MITRKTKQDVTNQIVFRCGKLVEFSDYREDDTLIWFNTFNGKMSSVVNRNVFNRAKANFRSLFKKKLDAEDYLMYVEMECKLNGRKCIYFFPVTRNGLLCDTFLEQRVYNIIEQYLYENRELKFAKTGENDVYKESHELAIYDTVDCGFIEMIGVKNKKVVVEIFDAMVNEECAELARLKIDYINSCNWIYLLDIYPEDDNNDVLNKLTKLTNWFVNK